MNTAIKTVLKSFILLSFSLLFCCCKNSGITTPEDAKLLRQYHIEKNTCKPLQLKENDLSLYVDYSSCIVQGQTSSVYQAILPSLVDKTKHYYSIKGEEIKKENLTDSSTYQRLLSVQEVNYAELKKASEIIADGNGESVLITDGEYYNPTVVKANENNPYLAYAFKTWMKKGHDIFIIAEPYIEEYKGQAYNKKRFYFLFTDTRLKNNIYKCITETAELETFPNVEIFHLSADHPTLLMKCSSTIPNVNLSAKTTSYESMEIQEWNLDWKNIEVLVMGAKDEETGEQLENGEAIMTGLKIDKSSFGGYKIKDIRVEVKDINSSYMDYCERKKTGIKNNEQHKEEAHSNFITYDKQKFDENGTIDLYFDINNLDNSFLVGNPYNYFKIELFISDIQNTFTTHKDYFVFDALGKQNIKNYSVSASIEQCLTDTDLQNQMKIFPFYTIYIQSNKN